MSGIPDSCRHGTADTDAGSGFDEGMPNPVLVGPPPLTLDDVVAVARDGAPVVLTDEALTAVAAARARIDELAAGEVPTYGISTGFGALATRHIPTELREKLQRSLDPLARRGHR